MTIPLTQESGESRASARPVRCVELDVDGRVRRLTSSEARQLAEALTSAARVIDQARS